MACVCWLIAGPASAEEPTLATVLQRAAAYVALVERGVSGIVAEERYGQQWTVLPRGTSTNEQRRVDVPLDVADVVAGALRQDGFELIGHRSRRLQKQLHQPLVAIPHRRAVDVEDIAELREQTRGLDPDDQQVGDELALALLVGLHPARQHRPSLPVALLSHDA